MKPGGVQSNRAARLWQQALRGAAPPETSPAAGQVGPAQVGAETTYEEVRADPLGLTDRAGAPESAPVSDRAVQKLARRLGPDGALELLNLEGRVDELAAAGARALGPASQGVARAVDLSTDRVLDRLAEGSLSLDEARRALGQLDLVARAMAAVESGRMENLRRGAPNLLDPQFEALVFDIRRGDDVYSVHLATRPRRGKGEARIGFTIFARNGAPLGPEEQIGLRVDHQKLDDTVAVDVASSFLDEKVHGPLRDASGRPIRGGTVPNHHFDEGIPDELDDPEAFAAFVESFRRGHIDPLEEQLPPPRGIPYQEDNEVSLQAIEEFQGAEVAQELAALDNRLDELARRGAEALGPAAEGVARAIDQTTDRILGRVAAGQLSPDEAKQAMNDVRLLDKALNAFAQRPPVPLAAYGGNLADPSFRGYKFQLTDGDDTYTVKVTTRAEAGVGEARVGLKIVEKNGRKLNRFDQLSLRVDLQKYDGRVAVDVATSFLDRRVHGMMDPGQTQGRTGIPDHHFTEGIPPDLQRPEVFARFVRDVRSRVLEPAAAGPGEAPDAG